MKKALRSVESPEIRQRAAQIRKQWSPLEKNRRTGLPPDVPALLRQFILGDSQPVWNVVAVRALATAAPTP